MPRRFLKTVPLLLFFHLVVPAATADPLPLWPPRPDIRSPADIPTPETTRLVHDLTADDYPTRDRAYQELLAKGLNAYPGLRSIAIASKSPELFARVGPLLKSEPFILPALLPTRAVSIMQAYERVRKRDAVDSERLAVLLNFRPDDEAADLAFRFLEAQESLPAGRAALALKSEDRAEMQARLAIIDGDFDHAEQNLFALLHSHNAFSAAPDYIALIALRAGNTFDPRALLEKIAAEPLDPDLRNFLALLAWRAANNPAAAAQFAHKLPDAVFTPAALVEARDYDALSTLPQIILRSPGQPPDRRFQLLALRFSSHADLFENLVQRIRTPDSISTFDSSAPVDLLLADHVDDTLAFLRSTHQNTEAALILIRQLRLREAFRLDLPCSPEIMGLLVQMGFVRQAEEFRALHQSDFGDNARAAAEADLQLARQLRAAGFSTDADRYESAAWPHLALPLSPVWFATVAQYDDARFWLDALPAELPDGAGRLTLLRKILAGQYRPTLTPAIVPDLLRTLHDLHSLATAFNALARSGNLDIAQKLLDAWCSRENDPSACEILGDWHLDHLRPDLAAAAYLRAAALQRTNASLMYRTGMALSRQPAAKDAGQRLLQTSLLLVLATNPTPYLYANAIRRCEGDERANQWLDAYTARFGRPQLFSSGGRLPRARVAAEARNDIPEALALQIQSFFAPTDTDNLPAWPALLADLARYHRLAALNALAQNDLPALADHLEKSLNAGPPDIDLLERTLPVLQKSDPAAATRILAAAVARLTPITTDNPTLEPYTSQLTRLQKLATPTTPTTPPTPTTPAVPHSAP